MCIQLADSVNPNLQKDYTVLPGMKIWNGVPYHDFRRVWFATLIVALGSIFQEGWTLIQVARDQDLGGPAVGGTPAQQHYEKYPPHFCPGRSNGSLGPNAKRPSWTPWCSKSRQSFRPSTRTRPRTNVPQVPSPNSHPRMYVEHPAPSLWGRLPSGAHTHME